VDGRHDIFFGAVGEDTHEHVWIKFTADDAAIGTRLKDRGVHAGPPSELNAFSTEALARVRLTWDPDQVRVVTVVSDVLCGEPQSAAPVVADTSGGKRDPVRIDVNAPPQARVVDCVLAITRPDSLPSVSALTTELAQLNFGTDSPFGLAMIIEKWSTECAE